jgi:hypothetical protein
LNFKNLIMSKYGFLFCLLLCCFGSINKAQCQVLLQLEVKNEVEAIKFSPGQVLTIKTKDIPEWEKRTIARLIPETNLIVFEDGVVSLDAITHMKLPNQVANIAGKAFTTFGSGWLLFGGIAHVARGDEFTWSTFAIGAVAVGIGVLFSRIASKRKYTIGKNANLRIIDISFPDPKEVLSTKKIITP